MRLRTPNIVRLAIRCLVPIVLVWAILSTWLGASWISSPDSGNTQIYLGSTSGAVFSGRSNTGALVGFCASHGASSFAKSARIGWMSLRRRFEYAASTVTVGGLPSYGHVPQLPRSFSRSAVETAPEASKSHEPGLPH